MKQLELQSRLRHIVEACEKIDAVWLIVQREIPLLLERVRRILGSLA
jgi:hypothetical protein